MSALAKKVYGLFDSIEEMAEELGESPHVLRRARDLGQLPDARHDRAIAIRARALGKQISVEQLAEVRAMRPEIALQERQELIRHFIEKAGGYQAVSERTGVSRAHLYANATRGFLNRTARHEYKVLAQEIGFDLMDEIFQRPKG